MMQKRRKKPNKEKQRRANRTRKSSYVGDMLRQYLSHHRQCLGQSLDKLWQTPLASLMTLFVIGIALAFPAGLYIVLNNVKALSIRWDAPQQISLFLTQETSRWQAIALQQTLQDDKEVAKTTLIKKEQALAEFSTDKEVNQALSVLPENPLPDVIVVTPKSHLSADALNALKQRLEKSPEVELAELDLAWVKKLMAIVGLGKHTIWLLAGLLGFAVILISGNTIRLTIERHRTEIEVTKLIGATVAFIRRPFLYLGLWFGLIGGIIACTIIYASLWILNFSVRELATLYQSHFELSGLSIEQGVGLLTFSLLLGFLGAWLAVSRHIASMQEG